MQPTQSQIEHGGIVFSLKAHAICANCTNYADYHADPECTTLEQFGDAAVRNFREHGWRIGLFVSEALCPDCANDTPF